MPATVTTRKISRPERLLLPITGELRGKVGVELWVNLRVDGKGLLNLKRASVASENGCVRPGRQTSRRLPGPTGVLRPRNCRIRSLLPPDGKSSRRLADRPGRYQ